jgi:ABC-type transporter Mla subunit MlaD
VTSTTELKQQLSDADRIIAQLKDFAVENAKLLIDLKENSHAIVDSNANIYEEADAYKASVLGTLKRLNISQDKIDEVDQSDRQLVLEFYENAVFRFGSDTLHCSSEQARAAFGSDYNKLPPEKKQSADDLVKLLEKYHLDISAVSPYLDDFRVYVAHKKQRRPDVWSQRGTWGFGLSGSVFHAPLGCPGH